MQFETFGNKENPAVMFFHAIVVAPSIGANLAAAFVSRTKIPVEHAFFDGGQFAQIKKVSAG